MMCGQAPKPAAYFKDRPDFREVDNASEALHPHKEIDVKPRVHCFVDRNRIDAPAVQCRWQAVER
jgi:hypothetical protein